MDAKSVLVIASPNCCRENSSGGEFVVSRFSHEIIIIFATNRWWRIRFPNFFQVNERCETMKASRFDDNRPKISPQEKPRTFFSRVKFPRKFSNFKFVIKDKACQLTRRGTGKTRASLIYLPSRGRVLGRRRCSSFVRTCVVTRGAFTVHREERPCLHY